MSPTSAAISLQERRVLAIVLPELLCELALPEPRSHESRPHEPRGVVVTESETSSWDASTRLHAINFAARERGVRPRQTIAEASALVANLKVLALPRARICGALKQIAEVALGFGSPVSFGEPDTVWVDISGSSHLFGSEQELATELVSSIRGLGHTVRVGIANGPWVAQAFARHASHDESIVVLASNQTELRVGSLPIFALPIEPEAIAWFAQLGLLSIADLRRLPPSALAARLTNFQRGLPARGRSLVDSKGEPATGVELGSIFDLIRGHDEGVLIPYHPEETPSEESSWDEPLDDVEPLLFVLKGLAGRLGARLEGRGQAAQDLLLSIHHDGSIAALQSAATGRDIPLRAELHFRLATPLVHADDLERVVRCRLQRAVLAAPAIGLTLQATSVTRAQSWQLGLSSSMGLGSDIVADPRSIAVLVSELAADIGSAAVGVLSANDSHLLEKCSRLTSISELKYRSSHGRLPHGALSHSSSSQSGMPGSNSAEICNSAPNSSAKEPSINENARGLAVAGVAPSLPGSTRPSLAGDAALLSGEGAGTDLGHEVLAAHRLPTRLLGTPLQLTAPIDRNELWVLHEQPFVVESIRFIERLEAIEWWESEPVFRDYFRVWLAAIGRHHSTREGMEVLAYLDRQSGKSYVQALYD